MKRSTTEDYPPIDYNTLRDQMIAADALAHDINAARGLKPDPSLIQKGPATHDPVNQPIHYRSHPSGIEAIQITEHMSFCLGNAIKYIWRADLKGDAIEDLKKALWYIEREIKKRAK